MLPLSDQYSLGLTKELIGFDEKRSCVIFEVKSNKSNKTIFYEYVNIQDQVPRELGGWKFTRSKL